jgi:hypothetical protein
MGAEFILIQLVTPLAAIVLCGPVVLYLVARWRAQRDTTPDPQLGFKFALHYFATIAFHVALVGTVLLIYTMIKPGGEDGEPKGKLYRLAFGFLVPGGLVLGAHIALLLRTNDAQLTGVRRLFAGFNLLLTGLVGFAALVLGFQALFAKGSTDGMGHLGGAGILVYVTAWGLLAWRYSMMIFSDGSGALLAPMPEIVPPLGSPPQAAPGGSRPQSGGGLPPLGGGSFPPIDR